MSSNNNKPTFQTETKQLLAYKFSSPTLVWFFSLWLIGIMSMISFNIVRVGLNMEGLTGGPSYYAILFLYYGLNKDAAYDSPYLEGIGAWVFAPFIAVWLGIALFYIQYAGYSKNGGTFLDPDGTRSFAFFNDNVFGFGINIFGNKGNLFYIGIVWLPIIAASIITTVYTKRIKRETSLVTRFFFNFLIALWTGIEMAKMTDPSLSFSLQGAYDSLFVDRRFNTFVIYDGEYHPTMLALIFTLFQIVPMVVFGLIGSSADIYRSTRESMVRYRLRREMHAQRKLDGISTLPWEADNSGKPDSESQK